MKAKGGIGAVSPAPKGKAKAKPKQDGEPAEKLEKSDRKCWHWHSKANPGSCKYGDDCAFRHGVIE